MMRTYLVVMAIGALGCGARLFLSNLLAEKFGPVFPVGTLAVNVAGCFFIGLFLAVVRPDGGFLVHPLVRQAVTIGFLGGFTTFSSFAAQTLALIQDREWALASLNVGLSVVLCLGAVWVGHVCGLLLTKS